MVENCNGSSTACPGDQVLVSGTVCRARGASLCDLDDLCTGGVACPVRAVNAGTACRGAVNECDVQEVCDGASEACPADLFSAATVDCGTVLYTGPTRNAANCGGVNSCGLPTIISCIDANTCKGTAATCTNCTCVCN